MLDDRRLVDRETMNRQHLPRRSYKLLKVHDMEHSPLRARTALIAFAEPDDDLCKIRHRIGVSAGSACRFADVCPNWTVSTEDKTLEKLKMQAIGWLSGRRGKKV